MVNFRKVFAMAVVMLSCASIQAQEQVERDSGGFSADLTVIPHSHWAVMPAKTFHGAILPSTPSSRAI